MTNREASKNDKHSSELAAWGNPSNCVPLVFEHLKANQFLHELSEASRDEDGKKNSSEFKTYWRHCVSVTLQCCNAGVIRHKLERLPSLLEVQ